MNDEPKAKRIRKTRIPSPLKVHHGKSHYFRGTQIVDRAIAEKQSALYDAGLRPTESDVILQALLDSPYLFTLSTIAATTSTED